MGNHTYQATTWQIKFEIENATPRTGDYTLQVALASASASELQVPTLPLIFNDPSVIHNGKISISQASNVIDRRGIVDHEQRKISRLVMTYGRVLICDHRFGSMTEEPNDLISEQG